MPGSPLATNDQLRQACQSLGPPVEWGKVGADWNRKLTETLRWVRTAGQAERSTRPFQEKLWEDNDVAAIGQGNVPVSKALDDAGFRQWLAARTMESLPQAPEERLKFLRTFYQDVRERLAPFLGKRVPHLKIFRVMAALFPEAMTTVASVGALRGLAKAMGSERGLDAVERHVWVRQRIDGVLGDASDDPQAQAERMALPWMLYERFVEEEGEATEATVAEGKEQKLLPLPAVRRRRGLTGIRGLFSGVLGTLEYVREAPTRAELLDFLRASSPEAKANSLGVTIASLQGELAVIRADGDHYVLTRRGEDVLESQDPRHLADWILTRILGADRALVELRERGPMSAASLTAAVRATNPGLTSDVVPQALLSWFRSMDVVRRTGDGVFSLTEEGKAWAALIHWDPENLPAEEKPLQPGGPISQGGAPSKRPALAPIVAGVQGKGRFPANVVARLHAGLWLHDRRHFAVLTGLSGSGKTLLARSYAQAITGENPGRVLTLPVQPGWYDPGALLGYVNPLRGDSYVRTRFLDFLIQASANPEHPYVAILDEMNLSHPEQYMAPLLSAMETGDAIQLHGEEDYFDGIPTAVSYPTNLIIIGTVNMDETTHGLSDKVLDRAFVLEFWDVDLEAYPKWGSHGLSAAAEARVRQVLTSLMAALAPARLHFGWRVVDDVMAFLEQTSLNPTVIDEVAALDEVIYAKVLPKLRGDDTPRFRLALDKCVASLKEAQLDRAAARVDELKRDLEATGSARFWR